MTPRTIGSRKTQCRAMLDSIDRLTCAISPLGVRTATAQLPGPRIITPSRTACPPMLLICLLACAALRALGALEAALEALHPAAGVHQLLLARVERVAVRADLDVEVGLRRTRDELVAARAANGRDDVLGMDASFHCSARIAAAVWGATLPPETTAATVFPFSSGTLPASSAAA